MPHDLTSGQNQVYIFQWNKGYTVECTACYNAYCAQEHNLFKFTWYIKKKLCF